MSRTTRLIQTELRALLRLTNTEIQIAETRRAQARTEAVQRELAENADNARERAQLIAATLQETGGVPDAFSTIVGRLSAVAKSNLEQAQPFTEALLGDLALEHQLQDRARLLKALAVAGDQKSVVRLADRLIEAHGATVEWLTVVLAEAALGGPAALRPTPVQAVVGAGMHLATMPARTLSRSVNGVADRAAKVRHRGGAVTDEVADKVSETVVDLRDSAADAVGTGRAAARRISADKAEELPIEGYARLTKPRAIAAVKGLGSAAEIRSVVSYEEAHKNRADVVSAAQVQLARIAKDTVLA